MADKRYFAFVQFEFGYLLGPADGRYVQRRDADGDPESVVVLVTLGARERRRGGKRAKRVGGAEEPEPVPTARATLVRAEPFDSQDEAERWLRDLRGDAPGVAAHVGSAVRELNAVLAAHRAAAGDPYVRDVSPDHALVVRVGFGAGEEVAEGRFADAYEIPRQTPGSRRSRERLAPEERFAAILNAREQVLACEELVLRARADLTAARNRAAALQARIALETLAAELGPEAAGEAEEHRQSVTRAANAALVGEPSEELTAGLEQAVRAMERTLARRRL